MEFLADFHIHSRHSRATSRDLNLESLHTAALKKGITVVGTGDFTHPGWMREIREKLVPAEEGLFELRKDLQDDVERQIAPACRGQVRFMLTTEISNIYKKDGQVRKVHNLTFSPSIETALMITGRLEGIGNIASDGRPILGLDSRDLLEIVVETSPDAFLVPAHIWTPWFSVLGSKSGFDSIDECFEDLVGEIFSVETGLSSDPAMNWRLTALDRFTLMSNSDAHSAAKVGRESNRFDCELSFLSIKESLRNREGRGFLGTIEFFPEQGKYHFDGHRKCRCRMHPAETFERGGICPVCGKKVTVGVMNRVEALADRPEGQKPPGAFPYDRLVSLAELVGEVRDSGPQTKGVQEACQHLLQRLGPELFILTRVPLEEIEREGGKLLAEGIRRMRQAEIRVEEGYDGEFGIVKLFRPEERAQLEGQMVLAGLSPTEKTESIGKKRARSTKKRTTSLLEVLEGTESAPSEVLVHAPIENGAAERDILLDGTLFSSRRPSPWSTELLTHLNPEQVGAVQFAGAPLLIIAGPGTGKTLTLTYRIAYLIHECNVPAERILAVTFTHRAAREMEERLRALLQGSGEEVSVRIRTFHALGAELLREAGPSLGIHPDFFIFGRDESARLLKRAVPSAAQREVDVLMERISQAKMSLCYPEDGHEALGDKAFALAFERYQQALEAYRAFDYDDLVALAARALIRFPGFAQTVRNRLTAICVDEYQDVNLAQYRLVRLLSASVADLCAIGDPHQAIYGFRGASPEYFLQFEKDYPQGKVVRLLRNYRSTPSVLAASVGMLSAGIEHDQVPTLVPAETADCPIHSAELETEKAEAIFIAQTIERLIGGTDSLSLYADRVVGHEGPVCSSLGDIAVLFRLKALAPRIEQALQHQGIPYQGATQAERLRSREGRALLAILRWLKDPRDRMAYEQIQRESKKAPPDMRERLERFRKERIETMRTVRECVQTLAELDWIPLEDEAWKEALETLTRISVSFGQDWHAFVRRLALSQDADFLERKTERVTLATLHAAKGLEFPVVFIVGCEDLLLPCQVGVEATDFEEERRLFYVGMTRACRLLHLTWSRSRFLYGERRSSPPSRFLKDIPQERIHRVSRSKKEGKRRPRQDPQPSLFKLPS